MSQRLTDVPWPLAARVVPSGEKASAIRPIMFRGPVKRCSSSPVRGSQIRMLPLWAEATRRPSGARATVPTQPALLRKVTWVSGAAAGQSLTVPSWLPGCGQSAVGAKGHAMDKAGVSVKRGVFPASGQVPSPHALVFASRDELGAVGRKRQAADEAAVADQGLKMCAGRAVPEPDGLVPAAGGHGFGRPGKRRPRR